MADQIVSPGEQIKPQIDLAGAVALAERIYAITVDSAKELDGYDDKNFHLKVSKPSSNKFIANVWPHGYVLKIMNSSDSKKLNFVEAQCELMLHLDKNGIQTPQPQRNIDGNFFSLETLQNSINADAENKLGKQHVVRMLSFQDGTLMKDIPWSYALHYEVGRFTAELDLILQNFSHPAYEEYSSLWMLKNVVKVRDYLFVIKDQQDASLVEQVIGNFEENVLSNFNSLKLGVIHGDIHDHNLLFKQGSDSDSGGEWQLSAVLDLGDSHLSAYVIELAQTMAYMMLQSEMVESGRHVVAGYCSLHPLPAQELRLLKVCVCARLCQSLVLGLYTFSQCPGNEYVLTTQRPGWKLLHSLWPMDATELEAMWFLQLQLDSKTTL